MAISGPVTLLDGLRPSLDYNENPPILLNPETTKERFNNYISEVTDRLISIVESGRNPILIFPMRGSLLHYFFLLRELSRRKFTQFNQIDFLFSYKARKRDGGQVEYEDARAQDPDSDPEEYVITTPQIPYNSENPVIVIEDLKETGASVDASAIAYWNAVGLEHRPTEKVTAHYSSVKHVPGEERYHVKHTNQVDLEGTQNLNGSWITAGPGLDGGISGILDEELKLIIEILERLCLVYIEKPDPSQTIIHNNIEGTIYMNFLAQNSILNDDIENVDVAEHIVFRLLKRINGKTPEQMVRFMQIAHGMAVSYINKLTNES